MSTAAVRARAATAGRVAYAALFVIVLPVALAAWMDRLDAVLALPRVGSPEAGVVVACCGGLLMLAATHALWTRGRGLPMSPYPPALLVTSGVYRLVPDPIYVGAVLVCAGAALIRGSSSGLWIVTPLLAASAAAFVLGYERDATRTRFGAVVTPMLRLPPATDRLSDIRGRVAVYVLVILPSFALYAVVTGLAPQADAGATSMAWEQWLPIVPWSAAISALAYPLALVAPLVARRQRDLRRLGMLGLVATATIIPFCLLVPLVFSLRAIQDGSVWSWLARFDRSGDVAMAALSAFRVVWACIACELYAMTWPRARGLAILVAAAIAASSVTAGASSILDVVAGIAAYALVSRHVEVWAMACRLAERVANSWGEWRIGPVRLMSHGIYAAVGGVAGVAVATWAAGAERMWWIVGLTLGAQAGSALWAQLVEGSPQLLRPYGYFGGVVAVVVLSAAAGVAGSDGWLLLAAIAVGVCFTQALGRVRCLVQGCCHGRPVAAPWGVRHTHPRSRAVRLSDLGGVPVHPTALYSMVWTLVTGVALVRLWLLAVPLPFVVGSYLILIGLGRFVEEHYRGEPQTTCVGGLRLYQWLALGFVVAGALVTAIGGAPAPRPDGLTSAVWPALGLVAIVTYVAYGVDLPGSNRRFSRLV